MVIQGPIIVLKAAYFFPVIFLDFSKNVIFLDFSKNVLSFKTAMRLRKLGAGPSRKWSKKSIDLGSIFKT